MRQSACLVLNPITVNNLLPSLIACRWGSDGPDIKLFILVGWGRRIFVCCLSAGVQLLVFFCSSAPVVLFSTPGISRCRSQHVVSLFHRSIYPWFICLPWWSIDELENLFVLKPQQKLRARLGSRKTGLGPSILILTAPMRCFCCGSLLLLIVLAVCIYTFWFTYYVSDIFR